jgi:hypothetical protein
VGHIAPRPTGVAEMVGVVNQARVDISVRMVESIWSGEVRCVLSMESVCVQVRVIGLLRAWSSGRSGGCGHERWCRVLPGAYLAELMVPEVVTHAGATSSYLSRQSARERDADGVREGACCVRR